MVFGDDEVSTCKELGSLHSMLVNYTISNSSWISKRSDDTGQTPATKIGETSEYTD